MLEEHTVTFCLFFFSVSSETLVIACQTGWPDTPKHSPPSERYISYSYRICPKIVDGLQFSGKHLFRICL